MSALHEVGNKNVLMTKPMLDFLSQYFWDWYRTHKDEEVLTVKIWIIRQKITVAMARPLFLKLFGPETP